MLKLYVFAVFCLLALNRNVVNGNICEVFNNPEAKQDDLKIQEYLRYYYLTPPPGAGKFRGNPNYDPSEFKDIVKIIFKNKKNGFFVEAGAADGIFHSNSLRLEQKLNWTGLLIEPNPNFLKKLRNKNRNAWIANVCLSTKQFPEKARLLHTERKSKFGWYTGYLENLKTAPKKFMKRRSNVKSHAECFPLYSILSAINQTTVDYLSLDVEGAEFNILKTIPLDKVNIKIISMDHHHVYEGIDGINEYLTKNSFRIIGFKKDLFAVNEKYMHEFDFTELEKIPRFQTNLSTENKKRKQTEF